MRWSELERTQPRLAALGQRKLGDAGVVLVGTLRRGGLPRISPVEPLFWRGDLWLCMGWGSLKAKDLMRDPRILIHSIVASRDGTDGEFKVRGSAILDEDEPTQAAFAEEVSRRLGWKPEPGKFHLFRVDVDDIAFIHWVDATNDQFVSRWPRREEFVRRGTSATSQGSPEPNRELFDP